MRTSYENMSSNAHAYACEDIRKLIKKHAHQRVCMEHPDYPALLMDHRVILLRQRFPTYRKDHDFHPLTVKKFERLKKIADFLCGRK